MRKERKELTKWRKEVPNAQSTYGDPLNEFHNLECLGANSASFRGQCESMVKIHKTMIFVLLETRMGEHKRLTEVLRFDSQIQSAAI